MSKHTIVTDFGDAEVRRKSGTTLPQFFREWASVDAIRSLSTLTWKRLPRVVGVEGYPPFDMFSDWRMDFAAISAGQLGRSDWQSFRRLLLVHVPHCPLYCWYCFNDAWQENEGIRTGEVETDTLVEEFARWRRNSLGRGDGQYNVLRLSGGEPFTQPELVADLARSFHAKFKGEDAFLWVDTNLYHLATSAAPKLEDAIKALLALDRQVAVHACLHGANDAALTRNSQVSVAADNLADALRRLTADGKLMVYPRINPACCTPAETEAIFEMLQSVREDLPLRTYLGPIELLYDHAIDRMRLFQGMEPLNQPKTKRPPSTAAPRTPSLLPSNGAMYTWNRLLERDYGVGYGKVPRHFDFQPKRLRPGTAVPDRDIALKSAHWEDIVFLTKGWEKEVYAQKLLEILAVPKGARVEIEYENKWIEPTFLAHAFAASSYYTTAQEGERVRPTVLVSVGTKERPVRLIPLRWGAVTNLATCDYTNEQHSLRVEVEMLDYAVDFFPRLVHRDEATLVESIGEYVGFTRLAFAGPSCYFCQYVSLPLLAREPPNAVLVDAAFKSVVLEIAKARYRPAARDVYFRIKGFRYVNRPQEPVVLRGGVVQMEEGDAIEMVFESCNPDLGNPGFPDVTEAAIGVSSTAPNRVTVVPHEVQISKYGEPTVRIECSRAGESNGDILIKSLATDARIASFRVPFKVNLKGVANA